MTEFMQNIYVFLWAVLALLTFAVGIKQKAPYAFVVSLCFVFMTVWYALEAFAGYQMFSDTAGIIYKIVLAVFLAAFVIIYLVSKKKH